MENATNKQIYYEMRSNIKQFTLAKKIFKKIKATLYSKKLEGSVDI